MNDARRTSVSVSNGCVVAGHCRHLNPRIGKHLKWLAWLLLRVSVYVPAGFFAYMWSGLSLRVLIRFDRTGIDPGEPAFYVPPGGLPVDFAGTLIYCLGPIGWIVGLGVFGLALAMALTVCRWSWPLRVIVVVAPFALLVRQLVYVSDIHSRLLPVCLAIVGVEMVPALLAALLCRRITRRFQNKGVQK